MSNMQAALIAFEEELCEIVKECNKKADQTFCGGPCSAAQCRKTAADGTPMPVFLGNVKDQCVKDEVNKRKGDPKSDVPPDVTTPEYPADLVDVPGGGKCLPDIMIGTPPNCDAVYDIKTKCPGTAGAPEWPTYRHGLTGEERQLLRVRRAPNVNYDGKTQADIYKDSCGTDAKMIHPYSENCQ